MERHSTRIFTLFLLLFAIAYSSVPAQTSASKTSRGVASGKTMRAGYTPVDPKQPPLARLSQILTASEGFSLVCDLPQKNGYYHATTPVVALHGTANTTQTGSVFVNGVQADWSQTSGTWSIGQSSGTILNKTFIPKGSTWQYLDIGSYPGATWYNATFDDTTWKSGPAKFGYGGDGEITKINYGPNANSKYITTYFRKHFTADSLTSLSTVTVNLVRDDGAVVYLNDQEEFRSNMPTSGEILFSTLASDSQGAPEETAVFPYTVPVSHLKEGDNVISAEVHQNPASSSDLGFELEMTATGGSVTTIGGVPLRPGINRVIVETYASPDGSGPVLYQEAVDVWYETTPTTFSTALTETTTTLTADKSPYHIVGDLVVPVGKTLVVEAGVTLFFETGKHCLVNGRLLVEGSKYARVCFAALPGSATSWNGIEFANTMQKNRIAYADLEAGGGAGHSVLGTASQIVFDHVEWLRVTNTCYELENCTFDLLDCVFPSTSGSEPGHGNAIHPNGHAIMQRCIYHSPSGYNDVIDFTGGQRPGPILQLYDCVFEGASDDMLDLDGTDAHLEGNIFMHAHLDGIRDSTSNAVATGKDSGNVAHVVIARNIFYDNDHHILLKEGSSAVVENNTFIKATIACVNFDEPNRSGVIPGKGIDLYNNIFTVMTAMFENQFSVPPEIDPVITINNCIVPTAYLAFGSNNSDADPLLKDPTHLDCTLLPGSPAIGSGLYGFDMGALVPRWISIVSKPAAVTTETQATFTVWGPGLTQYRYSVDEGAFSLPIERAQNTLHLQDLAVGTHTIRIIGKNSASVWQPVEEATTYTWTVGKEPPVHQPNGGTIFISRLDARSKPSFQL